MQGLRSKVENQDFVDYISSFDFVCLTETFIDNHFENNIFINHIIYESKATRFSNYGRALGGVMVLVRKELNPLIQKIDLSLNNMIALIIDNKLTGSEKSIVFLACYLPPTDSIYWQNNTYCKGPECLEEAILEIHDHIQDFYLIVNGDLNSRTGCENISYDNLDDSNYKQEKKLPDFERKSDDMKSNPFGEHLLEFWQMTDCAIINGLLNYGNFESAYTYTSKQGSSTVDYFLASTELIQNSFFSKLNVQTKIESDHMPVELEMKCRNQGNIKEVFKLNKVQEKIMWKKYKEGHFIENLYSNETLMHIQEAFNSIPTNIDQALAAFTKCILSASFCMLKKIGSKNNNYRQKNEWFDEDCVLLKKNTLTLLKSYRKKKTDESRIDYINARKLYRKITKSKKRDYNIMRANSLANQLKNSQTFWKDLKSLYNDDKSSRSTENVIEENEWYQHFKGLFMSENNDFNSPDSSLDENSDSVLNQQITEQEIKDSIARLKTGKASGLDKISAEMLKSGGTLIITFLIRLFNEIFSTGHYPQEWAKSIIIPIYKKGNKKLTDNYRGISFTSVLSKCYVSIINKRIYNWLEKSNKITESQAGFRRHYSTTDHIYTLFTIIQEHLSKRKRKLYVAFVDLRKAFDMVAHNKLLDIIFNEGVKGKIYCTIKAMYQGLISCVQVNGNNTEFFHCEKGVRQGCNLSPTLFMMFINNLATSINMNGKHGYTKLQGILELLILLFADDLALMSTTPVGLQKQIDCLGQACEDLKLEVNVDKTKIVVFRKGGPQWEREKWFYQRKEIEVVNDFCYLGYTFSTKLSVKTGTSHLDKKAKSAVFGLCTALKKLPEMTKDTFFKIFDIKIQPILTYAAEVWGVYQIDTVERIHLIACKRFLGVPNITATNKVYGELNRYPLFIKTQLCAIRYWLRILNMNVTRLPRQAYQMQLELDNIGHRCWVSQIRELLSNCGYFYIWLQQRVENDKLFLRSIKQRLLDIHYQNWTSVMNSKESYEMYRLIKPTPGEEKYFSLFYIRSFRIAYTQFRTNVLPININIKRFSEDKDTLNCIFCVDEIEDVHHFMIKCPMYLDLRLRFLPNKNLTIRNLLLCSCDDTRIGIGKYIYYAHKKKKTYKK